MSLAENSTKIAEILEAVNNLPEAETNIYVAGENPPDNEKLLWIDTEDEDSTILETVATTGSFNDLKDVPSWIKTSTKPSYTAAEVGAATEEYVQQAIADAITLYGGEYFTSVIV